MAYSKIRHRVTEEQRSRGRGYGDEFEKEDLLQIPETLSTVDQIKRKAWQWHETYDPTLYHLAGVLTAGWAYKCWYRFNMLMTVRCADIHYQLRRPDILANKVVALKYLGLGGLVVPLIGGAAVWAMFPRKAEWQESAHQMFLKDRAEAAGGVLRPGAMELVPDKARFAVLGEFLAHTKAGYLDTLQRSDFTRDFSGRA